MPRRRAKDFAYKADVGSIKEFERYGFKAWLTHIKKDCSVEATIRLFAEFITFCRKRVDTYARYTALKILFHVATVDPGVVEKYNQYLHTQDFKAQTILNRMDAVQYAIVFIRFNSIYIIYIILASQITILTLYGLVV